MSGTWPDQRAIEEERDRGMAESERFWQTWDRFAEVRIEDDETTTDEE